MEMGSDIFLNHEYRNKDIIVPYSLSFLIVCEWWWTENNNHYDLNYKWHFKLMFNFKFYVQYFFFMQFFNFY
jgi:hypothetical protein